MTDAAAKVEAAKQALAEAEAALSAEAKAEEAKAESAGDRELPAPLSAEEVMGKLSVGIDTGNGRKFGAGIADNRRRCAPTRAIVI